MIKNKLRNQPQILNLIDFYLPVRGNLRRKTSLPEAEAAQTQTADDEARIEREISDINKNYDFDIPSAIDWDLLTVSINDINKQLERSAATKGGEAI